MSDNDDIDINTKGLDQLIKALKHPPQGRIGILGEKTVRAKGELTNAQVGAFHEFGTTKLPRRSFLREPLIDQLNSQLESSGAFNEAALKKVVATGSITEWLRKVMIVAERIVLGAFDSGGYGKWPPSKMSQKTNQQTLVETGQLRDSITSEVVNG